MPSQDIVQDIRGLIQNKLTPHIPARWLPQFSFGLQAFSLRSFQSAGSNARTIVANPNTASSKVRRLLSNAKLAVQLGVAVDALQLVRSGSYVAVDHSDVDGLTALVGAVQTRKGRALPCLVDTTYAHHIPADGSASSTPRWRRLRAASMAAREIQSFTGHTLDTLQDFADRLGFWPKLVFDRGFGNESIVTHLAGEGALFYVRLKAGRYVEYGGKRTEVKQLKEKNATIELYGLTLRVIRSPKDGKNDEPWYILTNDFTSSRNKIVRIYYYRFEIEETFKDMKHIFELKRTRLNKPLSLKLLLWFVALGIALLYRVTKPRKPATLAGTKRHNHPKKQISWLRQAYEQLQQAYGLVLWGEG